MLGDAELCSLAAQVDSFPADRTHYNDQLQGLLERIRNILKDYSDMKKKIEIAERREKAQKQAVGPG